MDKFFDEFSFKPAAETTQVQMSQGEIISELKNNAAFFIQFFLGEELTHVIPEFHLIAWQYLISQTAPQIALALPRGHAKTTLAKLAAVWYLLFTPYRFIVYVSNTHSIAAEACLDIINYMRSMNFEAVFGQVAFDVEQDARGFFKFTLRYQDTNGALQEKYCILRAFGAGQQVRGMNIDNKRPELAIVDDLESDENTETKPMIYKLRRWFFGPFLKAMARPNKVIFLGNMLSNLSLLYDFCEKSTQWVSMRFGCIKSDGKPLWPEMWTLAAIKADFIEYQRNGLAGKWFSEMMNMPIADGNLLIAAEDIFYLPPLVPGEQEMAFITIDAAVSKQTWSDNTAILVHAYKNGVWRISEQIIGKFTPDQIFWFIVELCKKWRTRCVGMQDTSFEKVFKFLFEVLMAVHRQQFTVFPLPHKNESKTGRISAWCSLVRKRLWALTEGEYTLTEQLLMYDPAKEKNDDDGIDAASMGATMTDLYLVQIMETYQAEKDQYKVLTGYAVCTI